MTFKALFYPKYCDKQAWANSVDPDQAPQNAASGTEHHENISI